MKFPYHDPIIYDFVNIGIPLNNLESYANDIEEFLRQKAIESVTAYEEDAEDRYERKEADDFINEEDEDITFINSIITYSFFQSDRYRYMVEFPSIMRTSLFLSCYAFLENHLLTICKEIKRKMNLELSVGDLKHNGIEKAQVYLKKVAGVKFPDQSPEWNYIKKCNQIRNCIVHNGSLIESNNKKLRNTIDTLKGVKLNNNLLEEKISLEKEFCIDFIKNIRKFLEYISNEYREIFDPYNVLKNK